MLAINAKEACSVLSMRAAAKIVDDTYRSIASGEARLSTPSAMHLTGGPFRLGAKGAVLENEGVAGVRLLSRSAPRLMLWSLETGEPMALLDESHSYRFRTGVSSAVCARYFLPEGSLGRVAIIGAGPIALEAAKAVNALLEPDDISVTARSAVSAQRFAEEAKQAGLTVRPITSVADAVRDAELVITITSANETLIHRNELMDGATVLSMGGGHEVSHDVWEAAGLRVVDDLNYALDQGDAAAWIAAGHYDRDRFCATLNGTIADISTGRVKVSRRPDSTVMAIIQGTAALDVALAQAIYEELRGRI